MADPEEMKTLILLGSKLTLRLGLVFGFVLFPLSFICTGFSLIAAFFLLAIFMVFMATKVFKLYGYEDPMLKLAWTKVKSLWTYNGIKSKEEFEESIPRLYFIAFATYLTTVSALLITGYFKLDPKTYESLHFSSPYFNALFSIGFLLLALLTIIFTMVPKRWMVIPLGISNLIALGLAIAMVILANLEFLYWDANQRHNEMLAGFSSPPYPFLFIFYFLTYSPALPTVILCSLNLAILIAIQFRGSKEPTRSKSSVFFVVYGIILIFGGLLYFFISPAIYLVNTLNDKDYLFYDIKWYRTAILAVYLPVGILAASFLYRRSQFRKFLTCLSSIAVAVFSILTIISLVNYHLGAHRFEHALKTNSSDQVEPMQFCAYDRIAEADYYTYDVRSVFHNISATCIPETKVCDGVVDMKKANVSKWYIDSSHLPNQYSVHFYVGTDYLQTIVPDEAACISAVTGYFIAMYCILGLGALLSCLVSLYTILMVVMGTVATLFCLCVSHLSEANQPAKSQDEQPFVNQEDMDENTVEA